MYVYYWIYVVKYFQYGYLYMIYGCHLHSLKIIYRNYGFIHGYIYIYMHGGYLSYYD